MRRANPLSTLITTTRTLRSLSSPPFFTHRTLTSTPRLLKKGGKQDSKRTVQHNVSILQSQSQSSSSSASEEIDAFDFTDYKAAIERAHERLKGELGKVKAGGWGRNAEEIEGVRVVLGEGGGGKGKGKVKGEGNGGGRGDQDRGGEGGGGSNREREKSVKLGDVASVVARGRNVSVLVGEKTHLKPILSSLAAVPSLSYNHSPTGTDTNDPLTITIAVPPVTAESRALAKKDADKRGEEALFALKEARAAQRKRHRRMGLGRLVGPDELFRAEKEVERMNEGAVREARGLVEGCRRGLEGG